jgi:hypothetical protein
MRTSLKKLATGAVAIVSLIGASFATPASADAHGWHHGGGFVPGFIAGSALGAFAAAPYYYGGPYYYGPDCYRVREVFINRWGHRVVRWVRRCD